MGLNLRNVTSIIRRIITLAHDKVNNLNRVFHDCIRSYDRQSLSNTQTHTRFHKRGKVMLPISKVSTVIKRLSRKTRILEKHDN